eukprot:84053_1
MNHHREVECMLLGIDVKALCQSYPLLAKMAGSLNDMFEHQNSLHTLINPFNVETEQKNSADDTADFFTYHCNIDECSSLYRVTAAMKLYHTTILHTSESNDISEANEHRHKQKIPESKSNNPDNSEVMIEKNKIRFNELNNTRVSQLKKILKNYVESDWKLDADHIKLHYDYKTFLEKNEFINAIIKYENEQLSNQTSSQNNPTDKLWHDCNQTLLLNDFHHLLIAHQEQFEMIHDILLEKVMEGLQCDLSQCCMMKRNHRDRTRLKDNDIELKRRYLSDTITDIALQQLFDSIHCYYCHSFDIGYKMSTEDKSTINSKLEEKKQETSDIVLVNHELKAINEIIVSKINIRQNIKGLQRLNNATNKFTLQDQSNMLQFSFGVRFFYSEYYKKANDTKDSVRLTDYMGVGNIGRTNEGYNVSDWYIEAKYSDLKTELMENPLCSISIIQWMILYDKAKRQMTSNYAKSLQSKEKQCSARYAVKYGQSIDLYHLVSMMVYCNYDQLQREFSKTYRKIAVTESDESLKQRHSNFAQLGRLLRETLECFSPLIDDKKKYINLNLFHGIDCHMEFQSCSAQINGPFSTSTQYPVAVNFCGADGLILNLKLDSFWFYIEGTGTALFDCQYLSDFPNEQEVFFVGGFSSFTFETIILAPNGEDYKVYIFAINRISEAIDMFCKFRHCRKLDDTDKQIGYRLLSHLLHSKYTQNEKYKELKNIPSYIDKLLKNHFASITNISFWSTSRHCEFERELLRGFFINDYGWINLELLCSAFSSLRDIMFTAENKNRNFCKNQQIYECVLLYLKKNTTTKLEWIRIKMPEGMDMISEVAKIIQPHKKLFEEIGWKLCVTDVAPSIHSGWISIKNQNTGMLSMADILGDETIQPTY